MASQRQIEANRRNAKLAGRPKGSIEETTAYAKAWKLFVAKKVEEHKAPLVQAMIDKALEGDVSAFTALLDRAHGKPVQAVDIGSQDGTPIIFMPLELMQKHKLDVIDGNPAPTQLPDSVNESVVNEG